MGPRESSRLAQYTGIGGRLWSEEKRMIAGKRERKLGRPAVELERCAVEQRPVQSMHRDRDAMPAEADRMLDADHLRRDPDLPSRDSDADDMLDHQEEILRPSPDDDA